MARASALMHRPLLVLALTAVAVLAGCVNAAKVAPTPVSPQSYKLPASSPPPPSSTPSAPPSPPQNASAPPPAPPPSPSPAPTAPPAAGPRVVDAKAQEEARSMVGTPCPASGPVAPGTAPASCDGDTLVEGDYTPAKPFAVEAGVKLATLTATLSDPGNGQNPSQFRLQLCPGKDAHCPKPLASVSGGAQLKLSITPERLTPGDYTAFVYPVAGSATGQATIALVLHLEYA